MPQVILVIETAQKTHEKRNETAVFTKLCLEYACSQLKCDLQTSSPCKFKIITGESTGTSVLDRLLRPQ